MDGPPNKVKISARVSEANWYMIKDVSDVAFRENGEAEGNFSESLDYLLTCLRLNSQFSPLLKYFKYKALYDRGDRSARTIKRVKEFEAIQLMQLKIGIVSDKK